MLPSTLNKRVWIALLLLLLSIHLSSSNKSRPKRYLALWCMNFPDCCDFRGADRCGFACPKCPIKLDKYGRRIKPTTTPAPAPPGGVANPRAPNLQALLALRNQAQNQGIPKYALLKSMIHSFHFLKELQETPCVATVM